MKACGPHRATPSSRAVQRLVEEAYARKKVRDKAASGEATSGEAAGAPEAAAGGGAPRGGGAVRKEEEPRRTGRKRKA